MGDLGTVIFVPCIMGSALSYPLDLLGTGRLWLNPVQLLLGGFKHMRLPVDGEDGGTAVSTRLVPGKPLGPYYGPLCLYLGGRGWTVGSPVGDWRRPLEVDAQVLVDYIRRSSNLNNPFGTQVSILCHSRGGLVTRRALDVLAGMGELARVKRVIAMGTPHTGSYNAVLALAGRHPDMARLAKLGAGVEAYWFTRLHLDDIQRTVRSWQSVYELLPDPDRSDLAAAVRAAIYDPASWAGADHPPVSAYLSASMARWRSLPDPPAGVDWIDVAGVDVPTPYGAIITKDLLDPEAVTSTDAGDGVVTLASAHKQGRRLISVPCAHDMLPLDGRIWAPIHDALLNGITADLAIGGNVLASPG